MTIKKVSNIILSVTNLHASLSFYHDLLGLQMKYTVAEEFAFLNGGSVDVALRASQNPANPGTTEIVFEVDDIGKTYENLKSKGLVFANAPRVVTENEDRRLFAADFRDPDGHILSITSWVAKK